MKNDNILLLLIPKTEIVCLSEEMSVRQALEKMKAHSYSALPVISKNGEYLGTITEGDMLWNFVDKDFDLEALNKINILKIMRKNYALPVKVDAGMNKLISMITEQNFVPVIDDRNILMGIVTRRNVMKALSANEG